jgi:hypothetical protein
MLAGTISGNKICPGVMNFVTLETALASVDKNFKRL